MPVCVRAFRRPGDAEDTVRAKIYSRNGAIALSDCVPIFERMGLFVAFETGYPVKPSAKAAEDGPDEYWIHAHAMRRTDGREIELGQVASGFAQKDCRGVAWRKACRFGPVPDLCRSFDHVS